MSVQTLADLQRQQLDSELVHNDFEHADAISLKTKLMKG